jgi:antitoxin component of MazEF toxin-antitoxin module
MEQVKVKVKKWGNSVGVILPKNVVDRERIKEGNEIIITIHSLKVMSVGDLEVLRKKFPLKKSNKTTQKIMEWIDKDLWGIDR